MNTKLVAILSLLIGILSSCGSQKATKDLVTVEQTKTELPVILLGDTINNTIVRCRIPLSFKVNSSLSKPKYVQFIDYFYNKDYGKAYYGKHAGGWKGSFRVSQYINNELKVSTSGRLIEKEVSDQLSQEFIVEPSYDIDTSEQIQSSLKKYLQEMKTLHVNTLSISRFREFKEKHPLLINTLLQGDSIRVSILHDLNKPYDEKNDIYITLPIKY